MWLFRLARAWIYFGLVTGCAYVLGTAWLYAFVLSEPQVSFNVVQLEATILQYFRPVIVIGNTVGIGHALLGIRTIRHHIYSKRCAQRNAAVQPHPRRAQQGPLLSSIVPARPPRRTTRNPIWFHAQARALAYIIWIQKRWITNRAEITRLLMLWEVANQTYQANKMSQLVASVWINRLVSLVIVVNCWFSPILHYVMHGRRNIHVRLARLLLDSCLDVLYSIGIPLVIFYPYYRDYVDSFNVYPALFYYSDTWYVNALSELRQVFVTSWIDLISKTTGSLALLHRLYVLENVLQDAQDPHFVSRRVLTFHLHSTIVAIQGESVGCLLEARPWGSSSYSCVVLEVGCMNRGISGNALTITDALDNVDPQVLRVLILSHCAQLEIPSSMQNYSALTMLKVYNTTIESWGPDAALHHSTHPSLQVLFFARVNMTAIPVGLLAPDFPQNVWDIEFSFTNLTTFPDEVTVAWANVVYFVIEASPLLTEVPDSVLNLPSVMFYLLGMNSIRAIPDDAFAERELVYLFLDGNPIDHLPSEIKTLHDLYTLSFRHTNISSFPASWLAADPPPDSRLIDVLAAKSPLCDAITGDSHVIGPFSVSCLEDSTSLVSFPIAEEDAWRAATTIA